MNNTTPITLAGRPLPPCPPLLLTAALLLWGYSNQIMPLAIILALLLESSNLMNKAFRLVDKDRNRLCDLTILTLVLLAAQQFFSNAHEAVFNTIRLLPVLLTPILFVQCWAHNGDFRYSSLFWSVRVTERRHPQWDYGRIDLRLPYVCICMLAAAMHTDSGLPFIVAACGLTVWLLWPRHNPGWPWLLTIVAAVALAIAGQVAILETRKVVRPFIYELTASYIKHRRNPWSNKPRLDSISRLKTTGRIALKAKPEQDIKLPLLLHEASYDTYSKGTWRNSLQEFTEIDSSRSGDIDVWQWQENCVGPYIDIQFRLNSEVAVVPLPHQACTVERLPAIFHRHPYGTARLTLQEGWVNYRSRLTDETAITAIGPRQQELTVPPEMTSELQYFIDQLGLAQMTPVQAITTLQQHFIANFKYSIDPHFRIKAKSRVTNFLLHDKRGHCEFFATATAMLLRQLGIPTRYAVGFVLNEYSALEDKYIARGRHAHAWVLAWLDGSWQVLDTTPPGFFALDDEQQFILQPLLDIIELLLFKEIDVQQLLLTEENQTRNLLLTLLPLVAFLLWRLRRRIVPAANTGKLPGHDSAFYEVIRWLEHDSDQTRPAGQSLGNWINRNWPELEGELLPLLRLHYRMRFADSSQNKALTRQLRDNCRNWLQQRRQA